VHAQKALPEMPQIPESLLPKLTASLLGARHSRGAIFVGFDDDARLSDGVTRA